MNFRKKRLVDDQNRHWKTPQMRFVRIKQREEQVAFWTSEVGILRARAQHLANCAQWTLMEMTLENAGMATAGFAQRESNARDRYLTTLELLRSKPCKECNVARYGDELLSHVIGEIPVDICASCKRFLGKQQVPPCSWEALQCCTIPPTLLATKSFELPADEDAAAAIFADPQAEDVSPPVPFPRDQGAPVNVAVRRHVERDVFVELFPDGRNTWSDVKGRRHDNAQVREV